MIDGPRQPPARGGRPDALVILCHGLGSNGEDLIALAPHWARALPHAQFIAPNAPEPMREAPGGYQWFGFGRRDPAAIARAAAELDRFIDQELARYQLGPRRCALVGFSQGAMMALHVGLRRSEPLAGVLSFSGALLQPEGVAGAIRSKPPILLIHGDSDDVVPMSSSLAAAEALGAAGHGAQWHISARTSHSIAADGVELGGAFLKLVLAKRAAVLV